MIVKHVVASIAAVLMTVTSCSTTGNEATAEGSADTNQTVNPSPSGSAGDVVTPSPAPSRGSTGLVITSSSPDPLTVQDTPYAVFTVECEGYTYPSYFDAWGVDFNDCVGIHVKGKPTDLQRQAAAVSNETNASKMTDRQVVESLTYVYGKCAQSGVDSYDYFVADDPLRSGQMAEFQAAMMVCPEHPDATEINKRIKAVGKIVGKPRTSFGTGLWRVGKDIEPGTYVSQGNDDGCYWERINRNGNIIDNNLSNGSRSQVTIKASDFEFKSEFCNKWVKK